MIVIYDKIERVSTIEVKCSMKACECQKRRCGRLKIDTYARLERVREFRLQNFQYCKVQGIQNHVLSLFSFYDTKSEHTYRHILFWPRRPVLTDIGCRGLKGRFFSVASCSAYPWGIPSCFGPEARQFLVIKFKRIDGSFFTEAMKGH